MCRQHLRNRMRLMSLCILVVVLAGCSGQSESEERLISTYASVLISRESSIDSAQSKRRFDSIINANGYTESGFEGALREQSTDRERFKKFYDSVVARVKLKRPPGSK